LPSAAKLPKGDDPRMIDPGLDSDLKERLRDVLERHPVTEAELRKVLDEGRVCALLVRGRLERGEQRLSELTADPESPLAELASALRVVNDLRPRLSELESTLAELRERAPEFRRSWLTGRPAR
jgi:predicted nuclease with TOPRIM domain